MSTIVPLRIGPFQKRITNSSYFPPLKLYPFPLDTTLLHMFDMSRNE